jgi:hypothetical protein
MNLKQAQQKNKLSQFIREREKDAPKTSKRRFSRVVKSMASQTLKPTLGTSRGDSRAS